MTYYMSVCGVLYGLILLNLSYTRCTAVIARSATRDVAISWKRNAVLSYAPVLLPAVAHRLARANTVVAERHFYFFLRRYVMRRSEGEPPYRRLRRQIKLKK